MEPLLKSISAIIPDEKIDRELKFPVPKRGPRPSLKPSQMYRIHLLLCLKRLPSFRHLREELLYHRDFRTFAHLKNKLQVPTLRALSEFRCCGSLLLQQINQLYLSMIFGITGIPSVIVAVPGSTDIRASTKGYPKKIALVAHPVSIQRSIQQHMRPKDTEPKSQDSLNGLWDTRNTPFAFSF